MSMSENLRKKIEGFPRKPGIYFFKNRDGEVIYIGKAHSLLDRVRSYFQPTSDLKITNILAETDDIDFILTGSGREAAFLENNFIRRYQPKFNLRLKDDKSFPYLKLTVKERYPAVNFTRRVEEDGARYFGPFMPAHQARKTIQLLSKYFGIRICEEPVPGRRKRPCLEYDLKLCSAPCVDYISEAEYRERVNNAMLFLEGKTEKLLKILKQKMEEASDRQEYEQAANWRDLIQTIEQVKEKPKLISVEPENKDIFGFSRDRENISLYVFFMREGKVIESEYMFFQEKKKGSDSEILSESLEKFYKSRSSLPDKILLPFEPARKEVLLRALWDLKGKKIEIIIPARGENKKLVELAARNAESLLQKKSEAWSPLQELKKILGLESAPSRIEGFDISNIGGEESVGSMVVFENGLPSKDNYRKYKIKTVAGADDVRSLQEVVRRRYSRLLEEKKELPDLILVDGGKGQLNATQKVLEELGLAGLPAASLAKKEEIIFTPSRKDGIRLDRTSPALKLFQNIRDEAHRFAISFHRLRRKKRSFASQLDEISGLGKKRKALLLEKYRGLNAIKTAGLDELAKLVGSKAAKALLYKLKKGTVPFY